MPATVDANYLQRMFCSAIKAAGDVELNIRRDPWMVSILSPICFD